MNIKYKKSSFPVVCVNNFCLKHRATTPFSSEDRYKPKVTRKHTSEEFTKGMGTMISCLAPRRDEKKRGGEGIAPSPLPPSL